MSIRDATSGRTNVLRENAALLEETERRVLGCVKGKRMLVIWSESPPVVQTHVVIECEGDLLPLLHNWQAAPASQPVRC